MNEEGGEEDLSDEEDALEEFRVDEDEEEDDNRRSSFILKGASHSIKKVLAGKSRTKQTSGINRFDRRECISHNSQCDRAEAVNLCYLNLQQERRVRRGMPMSMWKDAMKIYPMRNTILRILI